MSCMNLRGEIFVCEGCGEILPVYFDQVGLYQISDMSVIEQQEINNQCGTLEEDGTGFYYHAAICGKCAESIKRVYVLTENSEFSHSEALFNETLHMANEYCPEYVDSFWNSFSKADFMKLIAKVVQETQNTHDKRKNLLKRRWEILRSELTSLLIQKFPSGEWKNISDNVYEAMDAVKKAAKQLSKYRVIEKINPLEPRNLHPSLCYEFTVSRPAVVDGDLGMFFLHGDITETCLGSLRQEWRQFKEGMKTALSEAIEAKLKRMDKFLVEHGIDDADLLPEFATRDAVSG